MPITEKEDQLSAKLATELYTRLQQHPAFVAVAALIRLSASFIAVMESEGLDRAEELYLESVREAVAKIRSLAERIAAKHAAPENINPD